MPNYARARADRERRIALAPNKSRWRKSHAWIDFHERGDSAALNAYYQTLGRPDLNLSLYERNTIDADQALAALPETTEPYVRGVGGAYFNKYVYEGLVARIKGDAAAEQKAFEAARARYEKELPDAPDW